MIKNNFKVVEKGWQGSSSKKQNNKKNCLLTSLNILFNHSFLLWLKNHIIKGFLHPPTIFSTVDFGLKDKLLFAFFLAPCCCCCGLFYYEERINEGFFLILFDFN